MTQLIKLKTYSHGNVCKRERESEGEYTINSDRRV
jgi:hypothetical protein